MDAAKQEDLLPIMHPLFNLREVCKQCALLEDHLFNPRKRCPDCIRKHFLTIEALFEEAVSLDNKAKWRALTDGKAEAVRQLQARWLDGEDPHVIGQALRELRKGCAEGCFDLRTMTEESRLASRANLVASIHLAHQVPICPHEGTRQRVALRFLARTT